jgi:hypothetical protein
VPLGPSGRDHDLHTSPGAFANRHTILREEVFPEFVEVEFERVMKLVFAM